MPVSVLCSDLQSFTCFRLGASYGRECIYLYINLKFLRPGQ